MFHTFAAVEPSWNNGGHKPTLGNNLEMNVYEYYTFGELMQEIQVSKASPDLAKAFKKRCAIGIRVPQDHATLKEATEWLKKFGGRNVTLYKDSDEGHDGGEEKGDEKGEE